jgi:hypothetical protein
MQTETDLISPLEQHNAEAWAQLSAKEKALALNYKRLLLRPEGAPLKMVAAMSDVYEKYPDFDMGCVP